MIIGQILDLIKRAPPNREAPFALLTLKIQNFCNGPLFAFEHPRTHTRYGAFADERSFQSLSDYLPSGNLLKRSDSSSTARTSSSGRNTRPQAAGFDDPVEFRLA